MKQYLDLLRHVYTNGVVKTDRTGTGTKSVFGYQMRFNLQEGFPLVTTKKLHLRSIIHELIWFLKGETNIQYLKENGVSIWDEWADEQGNLGPVYGSQWRSWPTPDGRHIDMALPPCHAFFQFYVAPAQPEKGILKPQLSCQLYQRSADIFLGVPFNIASYALLTMMVAQVCDMEAAEFIHTLGDAHIYSNHFEQTELQLSREPKALPQMKIDPEVKDIFDFKFEDFELLNYESHPHIKAPVAV